MSQRVFGLHVGLDQGSVSRLEYGKLRGIRLYRLAPVRMKKAEETDLELDSGVVSEQEPL